MSWLLQQQNVLRPPAWMAMQTDLDHLYSVALQPGALSIASGVSVNAAHHTGNGGGSPVEAHGVSDISPNDHERLVLMGEELGSTAH